MIELKLQVSEIDYEAVLKLFAGSLGPAAVAAARILPEGAKEELAAKYLNASAPKLCEKAEQMAERNGLKMKITGAKATVIK